MAPAENRDSLHSSVLGKDILFRRVGADGILLNTETGKYYAVQGCAVRFCELSSVSAVLDDIKAQIATEFGADWDVVSNDIDDLVVKLHDAKLLAVTS